MVFKKGDNRGYLTPAQVRLILRIYWTDQYTRRAQGFSKGTYGLHARLIKKFGVGRSTIERITEMVNDPDRRRYPGIHLTQIKRLVKVQLRRRGILK